MAGRGKGKDRGNGKSSPRRAAPKRKEPVRKAPPARRPTAPKRRESGEEE